MIKEGGLEKKIKEVSVEDAKKKGKEKIVESEQPLKKKKQIELDEEVAKKLQEELEKEEEIQSAKDRELALDMAKKINEEYQRSLKPAVVKKVTNRATVQKQRKPSKTFLANQERRKMINFLKGALGVPEGMFTNMPYGRIEELYKKEMDNLKGDFTQRVEAEREMKERHDLNIQQPFPDIEEGTPSKDKEVVDPILVNAPEIIHWDILKDQGKEYFRIKRLGEHYEVYATWGKIIRSCSRSNLEEMHKVGMSLYGKVLEEAGMSLIKIAMEYLCMMFDPDRIKHIIRDMNHERVFRSIDH
ncbi:hypothetical protein L6452_37406 [Arctium lappa]|uniref:Uncharacterized protein n=1 Tax=Arctium lappa TaxID=4217 RepID=A0ACB8Y3D7_ARCLA|nr:hypothetical protein L6452_37406 [Arctium lappa]